MRSWKYQVLLAAFACACVYATDETPNGRHRTAKLVRNFPEFPQAEQRIQSLENPMYNFVDPYGPGTYAFGYEVEDPQSGNVQFRDEEKLKNGTVRGSYGYMQPDGSVIITNFVADEGGYRAKTEIRRANGQTVASFPAPMPASTPQDRYFPAYDQQASTNNPAIVAALQQQHHINLNPTYNPILDAGVIDPQYAAAIMGHIRDQQYSHAQGLVQYPYGIPPQHTPFAPHHPAPAGPSGHPHSAPLYDAPGAGGNPFVNFANQFPASLNPYNLYQNLQSAFPQVLPQQNPLDQLASSVQGNFRPNGPFGNFLNNAQSSFQQLLPAQSSGNPFGSWFGQNRYPPGVPMPLQFNGNYGVPLGSAGQQDYQHQQILSSNRPTNVLGDVPIGGMGGSMGQMGMMGQQQHQQQHHVPTTRRHSLTRPTKKRNKLKTRDGLEWFDDFLENRKRQVMYSAASATTQETITETTLKDGQDVE
uniref:Cuticular protein RR family n=1 Tax=Anopheles atroparvus TaxID=41427 RepID=A0AAG5DEZ5_ANOAO